MQPTNDITFISFGAILMIGLLLAGVVGVAMAIRHGHGQLVLWGLLGLGLLTSTIVFTKTRVDQPLLPEPQVVMPIEEPAPRPVPLVPNEPRLISSGQPSTELNRSASLPLASGPLPQKIRAIHGQSQPVEISELPDWRLNPPRNERTLGLGGSQQVLISQQYATVEEAQAQLYESLLSEATRVVWHSWPETSGWSPTRADLDSSGVIAERIIETYSLKVGEFENPVYRVSWLVKFDPVVNHSLLTSWRPTEAEHRARWMLGVLAAVSGSFGVSTLWLRRHRNLSNPAR